MIRMTSSAPWSVKGIDPNAREAAKEQARRASMTLGEWLSHRIHEEGEGQAAAQPASRGPLAAALDRLTTRIEIAEQRSTLAVTGIDQSVRGVLARLEMTERDQVALGARFEGALQETVESQVAIAERLAKLEEHTAGPRSIEAIKGLEGSIARLANQVYDGEGRQREIAADLRRDIGGLSGRLESVEQGGAGSDGLVGLRLSQAEARTTAALQSLEQSFTQLDQRLESAEDRLGGGAGALSNSLEQRLAEIAANMAAGVEAARQDMAEQLRASADGRYDRMDEALREMNAHVQAAEQRSTEAIERMGREVLRMAEALNRKVMTGEQRAADAIEQVGGEVARVVSALDTRLHRTETAQALGLEKLGSNIGRITERLTERIGSAERRSAQAIDDVGEQISRVTERLNQRYERSASDLAERIRQSEERTVRLLEDARARLDGRLADSGRRSAEPEAAVVPDIDDSFEAPAFPSPVLTSLAEAGPPQHVIYPDVPAFGQAFVPAGFTPVTPDFADEDIEAASDFAVPVLPQSEADFVDEPLDDEAVEAPVLAVDDEMPPVFDTAFDIEQADEIRAFDDEDLSDEIDLSPPPAPEAVRAPSTRELIEQARAQARAAQGERGGGSRMRRAAAPGAIAGGFGGMPFVTRRKKKDRTRTLLAASFAIGLVMMAGAGAIYVTGAMPDQVALLFGQAPAQPPEAPALTPRLAVALDPQPIAPGELLVPAAAAAAATQAGPSAEALLSQGRAKLDAKDKSGLDMVRQAANLGHPEAQRYLASLYRDGKSGATKDLTEARRWFERAAAAGDVQAMYQLGHMQYDGDGGPKNQTSAAEWFRKAAERGSTDSQYNLGVLYEAGNGVSRNPAEAYKWYVLAMRDTNDAKRSEARTAAERVKGDISPESKASAERIAAAFVPQVQTPASPAPIC